MMVRLKAFISGLSTGALIAVAASLWILGTEGFRFRKDAALAALPVEALPTDRVLKIEAVTYECPELGPVVVYRPTPERSEEIAEDYGLPSGSVEGFRLLGEHDLPKMEWGGTALSHLDDSGKARILVKPNPEPLLEIPSEWSFYVEGAFTLNEQDGEVNSGKRFAAGAQYEALRFARIHLEPFAEAGWREQAGSYAEAGVRLSLRVR